MNTRPWTSGNTLLGLDLHRRRVWIAGQRIHHGMAGALLAGSGLLQLRRLARMDRHRSPLELMVLGTVLMVHDWHDRQLWFRPGPQDQP
ncbi:MAG: hypothetical protein ACR2NA_12850 [Solirubrobacterales bacterium]